MALRLRLARGGAKKRPFFRIVVAENTSPRDGKFVERVGSYNPLLEKGHDQRLVANLDRVRYWMSVGVIASDKVLKLLAELGAVEARPHKVTPKKSAPKKKAIERAARASS